MKKTEVNDYEGSSIEKAATESGVSVPAVPTILYVDEEGKVSKVPDRSPEAIASFIKVRTPGEVIRTMSGGRRKSSQRRKLSHRRKLSRKRKHKLSRRRKHRR